jgi:ABC-type branched-subunit amino acid transport system ATPase component
VLVDISLSLQMGEICAILGEEGAGKTTLLQAIIGELPYTGKVLWQGKDLRQIPTHKLPTSGIDYNLTGGNILKNFTVKEHLDLAMQHLPKNQRKSRWEELKQDFTRLSDLENRKGGQLSGGERMIVTLAALTATDAKLLLLDEPTAGLSETITDQIAEHLIKLKKQGTTILLLEYNHDFLLKIADNMVTLQEHQLSQKIPKSEFLTPNKKIFFNYV